MIKQLTLATALLLMIILSPGTTFSQPPPPPLPPIDTNTPPSDPDDNPIQTDVPFDSGLSVLLASGVLYGMKWFKETKGNGK